MSLNKFVDPNGNPVLFNGERILICCKRVKVKFSSDKINFKEAGIVYLTSHRVLWINEDKNDKNKSLSMPFIFMHKVNMEQPLLGSIKTVGKIRSEDGYSWTTDGDFELSFGNGGCVEFSNVLKKLGILAHSQKNNFQNPPPPNFSSYSENGYGPYQSPQNLFNFIQNHDGFTDDIGFVNQYRDPPPYPGACPAQMVNDGYNNRYPNPYSNNVGFVTSENNPHDVFTTDMMGGPSAPPETWSLPPSNPNEKKNL